MEALPLWFGRLAVTAFFAIAFLQSAADKWLDNKGNLEFLNGHFASSPLHSLVRPMFWVITVLESIAGVLCGVGSLQILLGLGTGLALLGLVFSVISLLSLFFGQRLAKDYGGAVVLASYFAVALLGLMLLGFRVG
jgi:putative oxidoreductase